MNTITALVGLAGMTCVAIFFAYKAYQQRQNFKDHRLTYFLLGGFVAGFCVGALVGYFVIHNNYYHSEGAYFAWIVLPPFISSVLGAIIGVTIDHNTRKGQPNQAL